MNEIEQARAALSALADPDDVRGVAELRAILGRCEHALTTANAGVQTAARATAGLLEFRTALVGLREILERVRDALLACEHDVDALYWARRTSPAGIRTLLALLRHYRPLVADLLFCLPYPSRTPAALEHGLPAGHSTTPDPTSPGAQ